MLIDKEQDTQHPQSFKEVRQLIKQAKRIVVWVGTTPYTVPVTKKVLYDHVDYVEHNYQDITLLMPIYLYLPKHDKILHVGI
jgi:hypothetical protein